MSSKGLFLLALCPPIGSAYAAPPIATVPPSPVIVLPNSAQDFQQTQIAIQQAQAEAQRAATQAQVQAELNANQARLEGRLAAQQAGTQAQLAAESGSAQAATAAELAALSVLPAGPVREAPGADGNMQLVTLTPQLGRYFGTDHGVLVARAPTHGVLKLEDGDVILSIGGRTPASSSQAIRILTSYDPGQTIELVILRDHRRIHLATTMPARSAAP